MNIKELTYRSYDPEVGSCILSIKQENGINQKARSLVLAIEAKKEILSIELELRQINILIRNLPLKKKKLFRKQIKLQDRYNELLDLYELPLKKL